MSNHDGIATSRTLPETLKYRDPQPLLKGSGSSWDFQASESLKKELKDAISDHFKHWKAGRCDKMTIPQYFIIAGAGEGKSRTAQELPKLLIECTNDVDLQNRLRSALVFNLSFENETKLIWMIETYCSYAIGNRMLFQLLQQPGESWDAYVDRYNVVPGDVLRRVAKHRDQELNDLNVIVILDGLQVAMNKKYFFHDCISVLGILSLLGPFIITCCTTTIIMPTFRFSDYSQWRVFLPVTSLQPPRINGNPVFVDNPVMKMLINDMGGHGRALEALEESISGKDLDNIRFIDLINDVRSNLSKKYQGWLSKTICLKPVLRIILSRMLVKKSSNVATFEGKEITVEDVTQFGLVRFESQGVYEFFGHLTCPYIWLWIMARASRDDKLLRNWDFNYYNEVCNKVGNSSIPPGCQYWQNFEYFVTQFRSLKSNIYGDNEQVKLGVIHKGAKHNFDDSSIYNRELTLEHSVKRVSTRSGNYKQGVKILCHDGEVDVTKARHIIINESGDSFCSIKMVGTELLQTETHQCKLVKQAISQEIFKDEHEKATSPGDTFILYTTASSEKLKLHQPMSAIVSKDNWEKYFGSFAGRCYNYAMGPPNLNEATYTQLTGINFIGEARARIIMEERNKRKFSGIDDCERRTKIPRTYLEPFF
ncbi:16609_t:CDS:2 [Acaulospora morrowiae]|uniref:16609_t:CDS:1 n=1 Tax=Acaulospora morrowiae TaxID=94023 RepID=A0A9N9BYL5_9GLOM|nr:16609_t:CDS:2 [Acaulospora morrowiae]